MLNRYPLWKYLLILAVLLTGFFYAAPNLYSPDPALQVTGASSAQTIDEDILGRARAALEEQGIGKLFGPGSPTSEAVAYIRGWFESRGGTS